ncbi:Os12g0160500 [Oryza sativa Japonica Group]|uniref:Associated with HOX family protein, expressed n=1 Tax=Oryza sativa subsp. japonica TaxID=39947 RepID=Q2QXE2_ORYSJ|nr:Associated with HOX family protein, expressed [Oryza sativa Japonica Group]BAT15985.1 Os12g0160500 [Oryza sativa Japonica Group]
MAAYFTGGGAGTDVVQAAGTDGLQTLYLMNPSYVGFTDAAAAPGGGAAAANMVFLNSAVSTLTPASFSHHHQPTPAAQHFVGIPLQSGYNLWGPDATGGNDVSPPRHGAQQQAPAAAGTSAAAVSPVLSLSSREAAPPVTVAAAAAAAAVPGGTDQEKVVMRSRYLKAAQELLDEAVSVSKGAATAVKKKEDSEGGVSGGGGGAEDGGGSKSGAAAEMSTAERQELQMKKSKLLNMLDEVEQRYRQYHRQMQGVAAAFEAAAGAGSATTYTSLALRTISRQFRCLRDAIAAQVRAASRGLGEDCGDDEGGGGGGRTTVGSRLRFIDHQLRQQRAMQQLGMVHAAAAGGRRRRRVAAAAWPPRARRLRPPRLALRAFPPPIPQGFGQGHARQANRPHQEPGVELVHQREGEAVEANGGGDVRRGDQGQGGGGGGARRGGGRRRRPWRRGGAGSE